MALTGWSPILALAPHPSPLRAPAQAPWTPMRAPLQSGPAPGPVARMPAEVLSSPGARRAGRRRLSAFEAPAAAAPSAWTPGEERGSRAHPGPAWAQRRGEGWDPRRPGATFQEKPRVLTAGVSPPLLVPLRGAAGALRTARPLLRGPIPSHHQDRPGASWTPGWTWAPA